MSHITCPVCGKSSFLGNFAPERMQDDIFAYSVTGLGRGRGFMTTSSQSILQSPEYRDVRERLAARTVKVLDFLAKSGAISNEQMIRELSLDDVINAPLLALKEDNLKLSTRISDLEREKVESEAASARLKEENEEMRDTIDHAETEVHTMLRRVDVNSVPYHGLREKIEVLEREFRSLL